MRTKKHIQLYTLRRFPCDIIYNKELRKMIEKKDYCTFSLDERLSQYITTKIVRSPFLRLYITFPLRSKYK